MANAGRAKGLQDMNPHIMKEILTHVPNRSKNAANLSQASSLFRNNPEVKDKIKAMKRIRTEDLVDAFSKEVSHTQRDEIWNKLSSFYVDDLNVIVSENASRNASNTAKPQTLDTRWDIFRSTIYIIYSLCELLLDDHIDSLSDDTFILNSEKTTVIKTFFKKYVYNAICRCLSKANNDIGQLIDEFIIENNEELGEDVLFPQKIPVFVYLLHSYAIQFGIESSQFKKDADSLLQSWSLLMKECYSADVKEELLDTINGINQDHLFDPYIDQLGGRRRPKKSSRRNTKPKPSSPKPVRKQKQSRQSKTKAAKSK